MKSLTSVYAAFDWTLLDTAGFKEDAVREELIAPLLNVLGYSASGPYRIHRSRPLKHPFVYLGSKNYRIRLVPDYVFEVAGKFRWVLDAKAPPESTTQDANPQQAYSYAIHPDIRARYFALCNGRQLTVFDILSLEPLLDIPLREVERHWEAVAGLLGAEQFTNAPEDMKPDLGLHLHRLGFARFERLHFVQIPVGLIARVTADAFTISGGYVVGDETFCASFDFRASLLPQLLASIPVDLRPFVSDKLERSPFMVDLRARLPMLNLECRLGDKVEMTHNKAEQFCPLVIVKMS